jgi:hypothetical protein
MNFSSGVDNDAGLEAPFCNTEQRTAIALLFSNCAERWVCCSAQLLKIAAKKLC